MMGIARVAVVVIGLDAGLTAGHRLRIDAERNQQLRGECRGRRSPRRPRANRSAIGISAATRPISWSRVSVAYGSGGRAHRAHHDHDAGTTPLGGASSTREAAISRSSGVETDEPPNFWTTDLTRRRRAHGATAEKRPCSMATFEDLHAVGRRALAELIANPPTS